MYILIRFLYRSHNIPSAVTQYLTYSLFYPQMLGLSRSKLNERYHSVERLVSETSGLVNGQEISAHDLDNMESVSQRGVPKSLSGSRTWNKYDLLEERYVGVSVHFVIYSLYKKRKKT